MIHGPLSPLYKLKKSYKILVRVQSITFLDENTVQGRFVKAITDPDGKPALDTRQHNGLPPSNLYG